MVAPDWLGSAVHLGSERFPVVMWDSSGAGCPGTTLAVRTFTFDGDEIDDDDGGGNTFGDDLAVAAQPFTFMIP